MNKIPLLYNDRRSEGGGGLRQCQLVQLHLLHVFHRICEEYHLTYTLCGGSALGAARHQGFIPWDDDLDVAMPMEDYKKFLSLAPHALPQDVALSCDRLQLPFSKIRDRYSVYFESVHDMSMADCCGIYLDIFPLDFFPARGLKFWNFLNQCCSATWRRGRGFQMKARTSLGHNFYAIPLACLFAYISFCFRFMLKAACTLLGCDYIGHAYESGFYFKWKTSDFFPLKLVKFEDGEFWCNENVDVVLRAQYGNWREIPPLEKRPRHATYITPMAAPQAAWSMQYPKRAHAK